MGFRAIEDVRSCFQNLCANYVSRMVDMCTELMRGWFRDATPWCWRLTLNSFCIKHYASQKIRQIRLFLNCEIPSILNNDNNVIHYYKLQSVHNYNPATASLRHLPIRGFSLDSCIPECVVLHRFQSEDVFVLLWASEDLNPCLTLSTMM